MPRPWVTLRECNFWRLQRAQQQQKQLLRSSLCSRESSICLPRLLTNTACLAESRLFLPTSDFQWAYRLPCSTHQAELPLPHSEHSRWQELAFFQEVFFPFFLFPGYHSSPLFGFCYSDFFLFGFAFLSTEISLLLYLPLQALFTFPVGNCSYHQYRGFHFPSSLIRRVPCCRVLSSHSSCLSAWC